MNRKFTAERLFLIRRMRKARRYWKQIPLFAFAALEKEYPSYTKADFYNDLRRRTKRKKKQKKTPLRRFGRYTKMLQLLAIYQQTGKQSAAVQAIQLSNRMTNPYRVRVKLQGAAKEYQYSALIPLARIEQLTINMGKATTWEEVDALDKKFRDHSHIQ